ncbi:hypothetical protein Ferp_0338 [Ferroglobus placidus DSM 10642]|uniref:Uncharacterized protein n=1 Tax=Ferroglobus placidus (strain DSM 10642 / AEDII12DO) TaxID=589924 RepID=D3S2I7_FERPA|nr:hypothetical protein [Ferroglobus placidus]ADC64517.1 hypothetical protein Ferp_0338 [Ferroglobus placidus DSM 10642]
MGLHFKEVYDASNIYVSESEEAHIVAGDVKRYEPIQRLRHSFGQQNSKIAKS